MLDRRLVLSLPLLTAFSGLAAPRQAWADAASDRVRSVAKSATRSMGRGARSARRRGANNFIDSYINVSSLARYALGDYYSQLSADQKSTYRSKLRAYLVEYLMGFFDDFSGQNLEVEPSSTKSGSLRLVKSQLTHKGRSVSVTWSLAGNSLHDVKISGLSLRQDTRNRVIKVYRAKGYAGLIRGLDTYVGRSRSKG